MVYSKGPHPHIRVPGSVGSFYAGLAACLFPAVIFRLVQHGAGQIFLLASVFLASWLVCFIESTPVFKKAGKPLLSACDVFMSALFFLWLPPLVSPAASFAVFALTLFFLKTVSGGWAHQPLHPVPAAYLFLCVLFQGAGTAVFPEASASFPALSWIAWILPALAGVFLLFRGAVPMETTAVFFGVSLSLSGLAGMDFSAFRIEIAVLAAFFVISDTTVLPLTRSGRACFAFIAAAVMLLLELSGMSAAAAASAAVLLSNALTPWLDSAFHRPQTARSRYA